MSSSQSQFSQIATQETQVLPHLDPIQLNWITNRAFTEAMQGAMRKKREPEPVDLLEGNMSWAEHMKVFMPTHRAETAREQKPNVLWIGCSDSRVPERHHRSVAGCNSRA